MSDTNDKTRAAETQSEKVVNAGDPTIDTPEFNAALQAYFRDCKLGRRNAGQAARKKSRAALVALINAKLKACAAAVGTVAQGGAA
jgi:hypothetical protein